MSLNDEPQSEEHKADRIELEDYRARWEKVRDAVLTDDEREALRDPDVTPDDSPKASGDDQAVDEPAAVDIPRDRAASPPVDDGTDEDPCDDEDDE